MKIRITLSVLILLVAVFGLGKLPSASAFDNRPSANGQGSLTVGDERRTFAFQAQTRPDGSAQGSATLHNRATDVFIKLDINCLRVVGNQATASGVISQSSNEALVGLKSFFRVVDTGEGANAPPDGMSFFFNVNPNNPNPPNCNTPLTGLILNPIENGNIQVKP